MCPAVPHFAASLSRFSQILCYPVLYCTALRGTELHYTTLYLKKPRYSEAGKVEGRSGRDGWTTCCLWEPWVHSRLKKPVPRPRFGSLLSFPGRDVDPQLRPAAACPRVEGPRLDPEASA